MLDNLDITKILFFDIETVPSEKHHDDLDETWKELWAHKAGPMVKKLEEDRKEKLAPKVGKENKDKKIQESEEVKEKTPADVYDRAGIYAEFGKIICISVGGVVKDKVTGMYKAHVKSFANNDEKQLLEDFSTLMKDRYSDYNEKNPKYLCGHNIKEFDVPYISRRLLINGLSLPKMFDLAGKKPWEVTHLIDTMELWKFGDYKSFTSLKLLAAVLGFPSPKDDIGGADVHRIYYEENDLPRIAKYCEKDVIAVMHLLMKYKLMPDELEIS